MMNVDRKIKSITLSFVAGIAVLCSMFPIPSYAQGLLPVPSMGDVELESTIIVTVPSGFSEYTYDYTVHSGAANDGLIWMFKVDISTKVPGASGGQTFPIQGGAQTALWADEVAMLKPFFGLHGDAVLNITQLLPPGWNGGAARDGFAQFAAAGDSPLIGPGESLGGFQMISNQPPTIRDAVVIPQWFLLVDDVEEDVPDVAALETEMSLRTEVATLGPSRSGFSPFAISRKLRQDLPKAVELGWITNTTLSAILISALDDGIVALQAQDGNLAKVFFQAMLDTIDSADPVDFRNEYKILVELNVAELLTRTPPTPIPFEPDFSFETNADVLPLGDTFTLTARYVNAANNDEPIAGFTFIVGCQDSFSFPCPNIGFRGTTSTTDANGEAVFTVIGLTPGIDRIGMSSNIEEPNGLGTARIEWIGGPDLVVPLFVPPIIDAEAGETIFLTDSTMNQGTLPAAESVTRYYISDEDPINIATAQVIGERIVGPLEAGEINNSFEIPYTIPNNFARGLHYLAACADVNNLVIELIETNNCSFAELDNFVTVVEAGQFVGVASSFSVGDASRFEGNSGAEAIEFSVSIDQADPSEAVSVTFNTLDGSATAGNSDYASQSGVVVFPAGTTELTQIVSVLVNGDSRIEADETFSLILSDPVGSSDISDAMGIGTILNDDQAIIQVSSSSAFEGDSGSPSLQFEVTLDQSDPSLPIAVTVSTQSGTAQEGFDFVAISEVISFAPGSNELSAFVQVPIVTDTVIEPDEEFSVVLSAPSANATIGIGQAAGTIVNDDVAGVSISDVLIDEGDSGSQNANFSVTLDRANPFESVSVDAITLDGLAIAGSDFVAVNGPVVFPPGTTTKFVSVQILGDLMVEADESFSVQIGGQSSNAVIIDDIGTGTILNDDNVSVVISNSTTPEGDDTNSILSFVVSIDQSHPQNDLSIDYQTQDGTATFVDNDYELLTGTLVFPAGTTVLSQSLDVVVVADFDVEVDEDLSMTIGTFANDTVIVDGVGEGTIVNDDLSAVRISDVTDSEGDSGTAPFIFKVSIDQAHPTDNISVSVATQDGTASSVEDYLSNSEVVTFQAGSLDLDQQFVVSVIGDTELESDETFAVVLSGVSANALILDDEGTGVIVNDDFAADLTCGDAIATPNLLWPPNHKLVDIVISGVLDENNVETSIIVTSIYQDEVTNGDGDGDTSPDGFGVGTDTAQVRRERSGLGDGRIYEIGFNAMSSSGASCSGEITIGVPHDQGQGSTPIDSGVRIDSTML